MTEETTGTEDTPIEAGVGAQLRDARIARGLSLEQVAAATRIPQRHLQTIEAGDFAALPARTYAIGFSKTYAKLVGLDENDVVAMVGAELDAQEPDGRSRAAAFQPGDPARVPSSRLSWFAFGALALLLVGGFFFMRTLFIPAAELPSLVSAEKAEQQAARQKQQALAQQQASQQESAAPGGPVVFTALEDGIWVKFYDADGRQLMQKLMAKGETYTVPADSDGPLLWTGRPDALAITIGGKDIPRLAEDDAVMRDVPVTAQALLARPAPIPAPSQETSPTT